MRNFRNIRKFLIITVACALCSAPLSAQDFSKPENGRSDLDYELSNFLIKASKQFLIGNYANNVYKRANSNVAVKYIDENILNNMEEQILKTGMFDGLEKSVARTNMYHCGPRLERQLSEDRWLLRAVFQQSFRGLSVRVPDAQYVFAEVQRKKQQDASPPYIVTRWVAYPVVMHSKVINGICPAETPMGKNIQAAREKALELYDTKAGSTFAFNYFELGN